MAIISTVKMFNCDILCILLVAEVKVICHFEGLN